MDFPLEPAEGTGPANTFILAEWNWFWASDLPNYKMIKLSCFKPLSLWNFIIAAIGNSYNAWHNKVSTLFFKVLLPILGEKAYTNA